MDATSSCDNTIQSYLIKNDKQVYFNIVEFILLKLRSCKDKSRTDETINRMLNFRKTDLLH